ncbi:NAD(P)-binding protein [Rossellomorea vietnamensis]
MNHEVMIIGAGQAGLSMGCYLKQSRAAFVIIDRASEIGEV